MLGITATTWDAQLLAALDASSREIDSHCGRVFFASTAARYFDPHSAGACMIDDCLSLSAVSTDSELDHTYDGETWAAGDWTLWPDNQFPKTEIRTTPDGDYAFARYPRYLKLTGLWGYGDGLSATPWNVSTVTVTVATTTGTAVTVSSASVLEPGMTIRAGSEDMYISAVSATTLTCVRGVNGSTAAAQSAVTVYVHAYPAQIKTACMYLAGMKYNTHKSAGLQGETIGSYSYTNSSMADKIAGDYLQRALSGVTRYHI